MFTVFAISAVVGGAIVIIRGILLSLSLAGHAPDELGAVADGEMEPGDALGGEPPAEFSHAWLAGMLSATALSAAACIFGLSGLALLSAEVAKAVAAVLATVAGFATALVVAAVYRGMARLQVDGTVRLDSAVGLPARVYLAIPPADRGRGKVTLELQGRSVEVQAFTRAADAIATGSDVVVVAVRGETLEVAPRG